jgi:HD-GYP domain-containing protein (c-di-GMP phosphodiesterase class II)
MPLAKARKIISEGAGTQWDPDIVTAFLKWVDSRIPNVELVEDVSPLYESADSMWENVSSAILSLNL